MKKNDINALIVYVIMLAIAIVTGLVFIRPTFDQYGYTVPLNNGFAFILLSVLGSILFNAFIIELGHVVGAKIGGYDIYSICVLWFSLKRRKGKMRFRIANFDGLTGETKVSPKDVSKSNPKPAIYMPMLFLLIEVVALIVIISVATVFQDATNSWPWWKAFSIVFMSAAFMIFVYQIFPAQLDNKNDGYLFGILTNQTNKEAYNNMLLSEYKLAIGEEVGETPIYDNVTDFTSRINDLTLYKRLEALDYDGVIEICEKTIACEKDVSDRVFYTAVANKVSMLIMGDKLEDAKNYWISQKLDTKKNIMACYNAPCIRAYSLVSAFIDGSEIETKHTLDKVDSIIRATPTNKRAVEDKLIDVVFEIIVKGRPEWDFRDYQDATEEASENESDEA